MAEVTGIVYLHFAFVGVWLTLWLLAFVQVVQLTYKATLKQVVGFFAWLVLCSVVTSIMIGQLLNDLF